MIRQVNRIRQLHEQYGGDEEKVIHAYATAERNGEVQRKSNVAGWTAESYARALFYNTFRRKHNFNSPNG